MQIQKINNQQNQNFKARINAPAEFWDGIRNGVPKNIAHDALTRISAKPGFEFHVIDIIKDRSIKVSDGVCTAPVVYTAKLGSEIIARKTLFYGWKDFLVNIANKFASVKTLEEVIAEVKA